MTPFHAFIAIVVSLVIGGGLGYAFRGKENAAIKALGKDVSGVGSSIAKKL